MFYKKKIYICTPVKYGVDMKHSREFEIAFVGLKPGNHVFNYSIDDSFFEKFEKPEFKQANIDIKLNLIRRVVFFCCISTSTAKY